jgi:hypothetical protein
LSNVARFSSDQSGAAPVPPNDPHFPTILPEFNRVNVYAEAGTLCRARNRGNGLLEIYVRAPLLAAWPPGTPPLEPGEQVMQIQPPQCGYFVLSRQVLPPEHAFEPSLLDPKECRICQRPTKKVWVLQVVKHNGKEEPTTEQLVFETKQEAVEARGDLAWDPLVIVMNLQEGRLREGEPQNGEAR